MYINVRGVQCGKENSDTGKKRNIVLHIYMEYLQSNIAQTRKQMQRVKVTADTLKFIME